MKETLKILLPTFLIRILNAFRKVLINVKILAIDYRQFMNVIQWRCLDKYGNPVPWFTFPAIEYLSHIDFSNMSVFEYVSGYSTLFWCLRAKEVISVENDIKWYEKIKEKINEGGFNDKCSILFRENKDDYVKTISYYNKSFDVIVIYGNWRNLCAEEVALHIKKYGGGILIFDNSDWYPKTMQFLRDSLSWVEVDFHGFAPLNHNTLTTSIFINPNIRINYVKPLNSVCGIKGVTE